MASKSTPTITTHKPEPQPGQVAEGQAVNKQLKMDIEDLRKRYNQVKLSADAFIRQHKAAMAGADASLLDLEKSNRKMREEILPHLQVNQELHTKYSLSPPPEDNYFNQSFDSLIDNIREWARIFTKGQPPLTPETMNALCLSDQVVSHLKESFLDLEGLLRSASLRVGERVRTRCVEAILFRTFTGSYLTGRYIGFDHDLYAKCQHIMRTFDESSSGDELDWARKARYWFALTNHLMTNGNDDFAARQNQEIDEITNNLYNQVRPLGGSISEEETKHSLREIVTKVARLGHEMAQLSMWIIKDQDIALGTEINTETPMENIDGDIEVDSTKITIVLCKAWLKWIFLGDENQGEIWFYTKARVSCIT